MKYERMTKGQLIREYEAMKKRVVELESALAELVSAGEIPMESELFSKIAETFPGLVMITDQKGIIRFVNSKCEVMTGYTREELIGSGRWWVHPDDEAQMRELFDRVVREGRGSQREFRAVRKNGEVWHAASVWEPLKDESGAVYGVVSQTFDITERRRRAEMNRRFAAIVEDSDDAIIGKTLDGVVISWNRAAERIYGYTAEEMIGKNISVLIPPEFRDEMPELMERIRKGEKVEHFESVRIRKDGSRVEVSLTISPVRDEGGKIVGASIIARDITERTAELEKTTELLKREMAERESAEQFLEQVFEGMRDAIAITDLEGRFLLVNGEFERGTGWKREEVIGKTTVEIGLMTDEESRKIEKDLIPKLIEGPEIRNYETTITRKDGSTFPVLMNWSLLKDPSKPSKVIVSAIDITELRRAEQSLRDQEYRFETVIESSLDGIIAAGEQGEIILFNQSAEELFGYSRAEVIGEPVKMLLREETAQVHQDRLEMFLTKGVGKCGHIGKRSERVFKRKDGSTFEAEVAMSGGRVGEKRLITITVHDITERRQAEGEISKLSEVVKQTADVIFITDRSGVIEFVNPAFEKVTGFSRAEAVGKTPSILRSGLTDPKEYEELWRTIMSGRDFHNIVINKKKSGELYYYDQTITPLKDDAGNITHFISTGRDISDRRSLEEQLRQSQKMEAIGRLAGGVAHDFNNLLTVITGNVELILMSLDPHDPLREELEQVQSAADRAADLTRQLLAFSRKQKLELKVLDLNRIITGIDKMLQRIIGEDIKLVTLPGKGLWKVKVDAGQVEQVIVNLATNARDAMPNGGNLIIETQNVELDEGYVEHMPGIRAGRYVMLAITDTGAGMTPEVKRQVFDPFFTTKETGRGTGLGLSTVYGIVKQCSGYIYLYSEPNEGTTFKIYLPVATGAEEEIVERPVAEGMPRGSETVMVVEDEAGVRQMAVRILSRLGYEVLESSSGGEAYLKLRELGKPVDLVITDVVMPGVSGPRFIEDLREISSDFKVLFISGYTDEAVVRTGILDKEASFLLKPFRPLDLARKVREVLDAR